MIDCFICGKYCASDVAWAVKRERKEPLVPYHQTTCGKREDFDELLKDELERMETVEKNKPRHPWRVNIEDREWDTDVTCLEEFDDKYRTGDSNYSDLLFKYEELVQELEKKLGLEKESTGR